MTRTPDRRVLSFRQRRTFEKGRIQVCKTLIRGTAECTNSRVCIWLQNGIVGGHMTLTQGCFFGTSKIKKPSGVSQKN